MKLYSQKEAAREQIDMAISAFFNQQYACSITLACAAEEMLPEPPEYPYLFKNMIEVAKSKDIAASNVINAINVIRNWLKHNKEPDTLTITNFDAFHAVLRGVSKYYAYYSHQSDKMDEFESWIRSNFPDHINSKTLVNAKV